MAAISLRSGNADKFAQQMKQGLFSKEFSDVKFVVGDQRKIIYGHRIVIGLRCPLLQKLFQESASKPEVPIILADVNPETFQQMMEFMYTNTVQINQHSAMELLGTAIEYGLQGKNNDSITGSRCLTLNIHGPRTRTLYIHVTLPFADVDFSSSDVNYRHFSDFDVLFIPSVVGFGNSTSLGTRNVFGIQNVVGTQTRLFVGYITRKPEKNHVRIWLLNVGNLGPGSNPAG